MRKRRRADAARAAADAKAAVADAKPIRPRSRFLRGDDGENENGCCGGGDDDDGDWARVSPRDWQRAAERGKVRPAGYGDGNSGRRERARVKEVAVALRAAHPASNWKEEAAERAEERRRKERVNRRTSRFLRPI